MQNKITKVGDLLDEKGQLDIPVTDIVLETLKQWKEKQSKRQNTNPDVAANLTSENAFIFANDDGSVRTYFGSRKIFDGWKK